MGALSRKLSRNAAIARHTSATAGRPGPRGWRESSWNSGLLRTPRVAAIPQRLDNQREGGRLLAPAWVVEMVARERLAPVLQHADQSTGADQRRDILLRQVGESDPLQGAQACQGYVVDSQLAFNAH